MKKIYFWSALVLVVAVSALAFSSSANSMQVASEELKGDCNGTGDCKIRCNGCGTDLIGIGAITGISKSGEPTGIHGDCPVCGKEWENTED